MKKISAIAIYNIHYGYFAYFLQNNNIFFILLAELDVFYAYQYKKPNIHKRIRLPSPISRLSIAK